MAIWSKQLAVPQEAPAPRHRSLIASALRVQFDDASYSTWRFRDEAWQRELWRLYRIIPELRAAASWVGQCCSRVRIYVADVDELGRVQQESTDKKVSALSDTLLGGPAAKAEHLRMMGIDLTVSGECYIIGRPDESTGRDKWYVVTPTEFRRIRSSDGNWNWAWGPKGNPMRLDLTQNIVTRVWTPDPERIWCADSPARSCSMILRELEQLTKMVLGEIDSRLVGNGILVIPNDLDLPAEEGTVSSAESLLVRMATAGAASLRGEGSALGVLPLIIEAQDPSRFQHITLSTELSKQAHELRGECVERLGVGMDMPPEALSGIGDTNHWQGFLIDGYGIKVHIEPLMNRICDALTEAYLVPALRLMDKDPSRYTYAFDTSPLNLRPQRLQDALNLYEKDIIGAEAVRMAGFFKETDKPEIEETAEKYLKELLLRDPQLIQNQAVREAIGIPESVIPQSSMIAPTPGGVSMGGGSGPPPPPPPPTGIGNTLPPPMPNTLGKTLGTPQPPPIPGGTGAKPGPTPSNTPPLPPPSSIQASATVQQELGIVVLAEATVRRGLELAGKRLLDHHNRHRWPDVPTYELHTRIKVQDQAHANRLLSGAWDQLAQMTEFFAEGFDVAHLEKCLSNYCSLLLLRGLAHDPPNLFSMLQAQGVVHGQS